MKCPKCESSEFDQAGTCPACGFHADPDATQPKTQPEIAADSDGTPPLPDDQDKLPQWRVELSRRLQEIKEKRGGGTAKQDSEGTRPLPFPHSETVGTKKPELQEEPAPPQASRPARRAAANNVRRSAERARPRVQEEPAAIFQTQVGAEAESAAIADVALKPAVAQAASPGEVTHLIDEVVTMRAAKAEPPLAPVAAPEEESDNETKLILLSRTLSGMIDLLAVFICTVGFVVAEDVFSGLVMFDETSFLNAGLVFLTTFFLYSLFFLGAANQTIGMMITHLRLVGKDGKRPAMGHIVTRCALYVPSVLLLGIGLLWGCFDREAKCLHDRLSGTGIELLV